MSYSRSIILLFVAAVAVVCADDVVGPGCTASVDVKEREGSSWISGGSVFQIYDLNIHNDGRCALDNIGLNFGGIPVGTTFNQLWNLEADSRYMLVTGFGSIAAGNNFNGAGFILSSTQAVAANTITATVYGSACPSTCVNGGEPTTAPADPTTVPTTAPVDPTSTPLSCPTSATLLKDTSIASWTENGKTVSVYRLSVTNNGPDSLLDYVFSIGYLPFAEGITVVSTWNVESARGGYRLSGFGPSIPAGATYSGAGFTISGVPDNTDIQVDVYGSTCVAAQ